MHINRGLVFWGVALVTAGVVALGVQAAVIDGEAARQVWRLWPVVLILVGLAVIAARTPFALVITVVAAIVAGGMAGTLVAGLPDGMSIGCGGEVGESLKAEGDLADGALVELDISCGELGVAATDDDGWALSAGHASGAEPTVTTADGGLRVTAEGAAVPFGDGRQSWELELPRQRSARLDVSANAATSTLALDGMTLQDLAIDANAGEVAIGLEGADVGRLAVDANAGSVVLRVDELTRVDGTVEMNAGSLELCAGADVAVAITVEDESITFDHNLDRDLERSGDTWRSGTGTPAVTLRVQGNAASFTFNPEGGC